MLWFSEESSKRRLLRSKFFRDGEKPFLSTGLDKTSSCKFSTLKLVLVVIILGAFFTLLHSPAVYNTEKPSHSKPRYVISPNSFTCNCLRKLHKEKLHKVSCDFKS